jgi:1-acyl-sn-glycerol-3-phosphate acyltransferase
MNDNLFKNALVVLVTFKGVSIFGLDAKSVVALAGGIFILPYFLFSPFAGQLADKYEKSMIMRFSKLLEIAVMALAGISFYLVSFELLMLTLFLMGVQSTFFSPVKYSILPQVLETSELTEGNALVEMGTFVAILIGTILGGLIASLDSGWEVITTAVLGVAAIGYAISRFVPKAEVANPNLEICWNPVPQFRFMWRAACERRSVFYSILAISWFWFFGAGILSVLPVYCKDYLNVNEQVVTLFLTMFTLGVGVGSMLCHKLSFGRIEIGLVPLGSIGLSVFLLDLSLIAPVSSSSMDLAGFLSHASSYRMLVDFFFMSLCGGLFIVPLYTMMQARSRREICSQVIASNNVFNAVFMVIASAMLVGLYALGLNVVQILMVFAILNAIVAFYIYSLLPEFALRFVAYIVARCIYRIRSKEVEYIPEKGAALLTCNHVSFVDWLLIMALVKRPVRFVMHYSFFRLPVVKWLMRQAGVIPIANRKEDPEVLEKALESVSEALGKGELVCLFPEGAITYDGKLGEFKPGAQRIVERDPVPVIPMGLVGIYGSYFSRSRGRFKLLAWPSRLWHKVTLAVGEPIPAAEFSTEGLHKKIKELSSS